MEKQLKLWEFINESIIKISMNIRGTNTNILEMNATIVVIKEQFGKGCRLVLDGMSDREECLLAGDSNSRVGNRKIKHILVPYGENC